MLTIRAMSDGKGYFYRHPGEQRLRCRGRTRDRTLAGRRAKLLALNREVKLEDFEAVRQGLDPRTNAFLKLRHSTDRLPRTEKRLSVPQSVRFYILPQVRFRDGISRRRVQLIAAHQTRSFTRTPSQRFNIRR